MTHDPPARPPFAGTAPALADYPQNVLFGEVWRRPGRSPRDRSLITVASLVSLYRVNELPHHLQLARDNGVSREALVEPITHLAVHAGWPTANTAVTIAARVFAEGMTPGTLEGAPT